MMCLPEPIIPIPAILGEGPIWDAATAHLWWVDIDGQLVHRHDPKNGNNQTWQLPSEPGTVVPQRSGGALLALRTGLATLDEQGHLTALGVTHQHESGFRFNDGKCDDRGRLWVGTLEYTPNTVRSHLYCWDGHTMQRRLDGIGVSNGIGWSPDGRIMYYIDTTTRRLDAFNYDVALGELGHRRVALTFPEQLGSPDGLAVDAEGMVWVGMWGGSRVQRCDPYSGRFLEHIIVPASQVTACAFGGADLCDLYITTAARGIDPLKEPLAGQVFCCRPGVAGLPTHDFSRSPYAH